MPKKYDFTKLKFMNQSDNHLRKIMSIVYVSASSLILLIKSRYIKVDPPTFAIHLGFEASPFPMISWCTMQSQNGEFFSL